MEVSLEIDPNEKVAADFLAERGFQCVRFSEEDIGKGPTPDFRVLKGTEFCFYCEVKSIDKERWLDEQLEKVPPGTIAGGLRPDPTFNRLTSDIHKAIKQFDSVNPDVLFPNVLVFVNNESICRVHDLFEVFTGNYRSDDGTLHPISKKYSDGRIKEEKHNIQLFIWIDVCKGTHNFMFTDTSSKCGVDLCGWLGIDPKLIKKY